jgi:hypothetical protein
MSGGLSEDKPTDTQRKRIQREWTNRKAGLKDFSATYPDAKLGDVQETLFQGLITRFIVTSHAEYRVNKAIQESQKNPAANEEQAAEQQKFLQASKTEKQAAEFETALFVYDTGRTLQQQGVSKEDSRSIIGGVIGCAVNIYNKNLGEKREIPKTALSAPPNM